MGTRIKATVESAAEERKIIRIGTYRRISTDETNQPYSLEAQQKALQSFVMSQPNHKIVADFTDQQSGVTTDSPGLQRAITAALNDEYDVLLVYRIDRLGRSVKGVSSIVSTLDDYGKGFRSATEPIDSMTSPGKMMMQILAVFAEFEHDLFLDRIRNGNAEKAARGEYNASPPLGYVKDATTKMLVVNAAGAAVIRKLFTLYIGGAGAKEVATRLNAAGHTTKKDKPWDASTVLRTLENDLYIGKVYHKGNVYEGKHDAILDEATWEKAQTLRSERAVRRTAQAVTTTSNYLLTGRVTCGACAGPYVGNSANGKRGTFRYYSCSNRKNQRGGKTCSNDNVQADALEAMVIDQIIATYADTGLFAEAITEARSEAPRRLRELEALAGGIRSQITQATKATERLMTLFEEGGTSATMAAERIETKQQEIVRFRNGLKELQSQIAVLSEEVMSSGELDELTGLVYGVLTEDSSHMERKRVLAALVAEIIIRPGKQVDITLKVPSRQTGEVVQSPRAGQTPGTGVRMETTFVEVRGFEPRTPCMPSARDPFTSVQ